MISPVPMLPPALHPGSHCSVAVLGVKFKTRVRTNPNITVSKGSRGWQTLCRPTHAPEPGCSLVATRTCPVLSPVLLPRLSPLRWLCPARFLSPQAQKPPANGPCGPEPAGLGQGTDAWTAPRPSWALPQCIRGLVLGVLGVTQGGAI